jgi:fluoride exporter
MLDTTSTPGESGGRRRRRPAHFQPASIGLVLLGGGIGAGCREVLSREIPDLDGIPVMIPVVNVIGAFLLGFLYEGLSRTVPRSMDTVRLKALLGAGFCGGLTTYSALATDTAVLLDNGRIGMALAYACGTVVVGAAATIAGIVAGARIQRHPAPGEEVER